GTPPRQEYPGQEPDGGCGQGQRGDRHDAPSARPEGRTRPRLAAFDIGPQVRRTKPIQRSEPFVEVSHDRPPEGTHGAASGPGSGEPGPRVPSNRGWRPPPSPGSRRSDAGPLRPVAWERAE